LRRLGHAVAPNRKAYLLWTAGILGVLVAGGVVVAVSGIVPIRASGGHWPVTQWLLTFAMRRSIATHSLGVEVPALDDPGLVVKGATHYELGCRPCHGSPDQPAPVIPRGMTPHPPSLPAAVSKWKPRELFYVVKHGVKFTGMPAWPAPQRDDEVWAIVAFLRTLPALSADRYRALSLGAAPPGVSAGDLGPLRDAPRPVRESCARCHGLDGRGRGLGVFPVLAGQRSAYLFASLLAFARGERASGIMQPIAAGLGVEAMREIALHYAALPTLLPARREESARDIERGREIAVHGIPRQRLPPCTPCHGPSELARNAMFPSLDGQPARYLALQLALFNGQVRGGTPYAHVMGLVAGRLTPEQMREVAAYYAAGAPPAR
jgi:cytochrome c553